MSKPIFRLVAKASKYHNDFGGQNELIDILNGMDKEGYQTEFCSYFGNFSVHAGFRAKIPNTIIVETVDQMLLPCDIFMMFVGSQTKHYGDVSCDVFYNIPKGAKKVASFNTTLGQVADKCTAQWSREFDLYIFENNLYKDKFLNVVPGANAAMCHTCVDIVPFLKVVPRFESPFHVVRLVSRPSTKIPKNTNDMMLKIKEYKPDCEFSFMSYASWVMDAPWVHKYLTDQMSVTDFLARGNCFWHPLPSGVGEPGPRVIVEAMASGLPVIATGCDGPKDRLTPETGWHTTLEEIPEIFKDLTMEELERKGNAARERALSEFGIRPWIEAIINK